MGEACPDCGHHLVSYRTERQRAGQREVVLEWTICPACRHVTLQEWSFVDASAEHYVDLSLLDQPRN